MAEKRKIKKVPKGSVPKKAPAGKKVRRVRRVRKGSMEAMSAPQVKKKRKNTEGLDVDTSFYKENPPRPERVEQYESAPEKPKKEKKKRRGCRDFLLGGCSFLLLLNLIVMGVLVFYANQALEELRTKDTEAIINYLDEALQDENGILYQSLLEGIVAPEVEQGLDETFGNLNTNSGTDFPIFPPDDENVNTSSVFE